MKVIAFNGSARKDGNTAKLINYAFEELAKEGIETELLQLSGRPIHGCIACYKCFASKDRRCAVTDDCANECIEKMDAADAIIIGSPTYFAAITPEAKALIDRCGMVSRANGICTSARWGRLWSRYAGPVRSMSLTPLTTSSPSAR